MSSFFGHSKREEDMIHSIPRLSPDDFRIADSQFMCNGGWGAVYSVHRKNGKGQVAMKFFGYTKNRPNLIAINREIGLMNVLRGVKGVVQLIGIFHDTVEGLVPNKNSDYFESYPVIVMELLDGGNLFDRVSHRNSTSQPTSELDLAISFRSTMEALSSVHENGYLHRDIKLDNLVYISNNECSPVKLIDFGYMCELPSANSTINDHLLGTEGCFAPESIMRSEYSTKSDVWQAGCVLYTLLAGHPPFYGEKSRRMDIVNRGYYPMRGPAWANISDSAKDLVAGMLQKSPNERFSVTQVLQHDWLKGAASNKSLGEEYVRRIKHLALRHKLKKCFLLGQMEESHKKRQKSLLQELPFLSSSGQAGEDLLYPCASSSLGPMFVGEAFSAKLRDLKNLLVNTIYGNRFETGNQVSDGVTRPSKKMRLGFDGDVDFNVFCNFMQSCDLDILANNRIFSIFDTNGDGNICMREFLMTIIAMREVGSDQDDLEAAQLYFRMFDIDEDGFIGKEELELVIGCLLHDGAGLLVIDENDVNALNVDEIFSAIDTNYDGRIDLMEFRVFYETMLLPSSRQSQKSSCTKISKSASSRIHSEPLLGEQGQENQLSVAFVLQCGEELEVKENTTENGSCVTAAFDTNGNCPAVGDAMSIVSS